MLLYSKQSNTDTSLTKWVSILCKKEKKNNKREWLTCIPNVLIDKSFFTENSSSHPSTTPPGSSSSASDSSDVSKALHQPFGGHQHPGFMIGSLPFGAGHQGPSGSLQPPPHLLQSLEALHQHHLKLVSADQVKASGSKMPKICWKRPPFLMDTSYKLTGRKKVLLLWQS